jgi:hypothetical protein
MEGLYHRRNSCDPRDGRVPVGCQALGRSLQADPRWLIYTAASSTDRSAGMVTRALEGEVVGTIIFKD